MISNEVPLRWKHSVTFLHVTYHILSSKCNQILDLLIPEEDADLDDLVLEVTAGVGGQEAMLFTAEVLMCNIQSYRRLQLEIVS